MPVSLMLPHRRQLAPRVQAVMAWLTQVIEPLLVPAGWRFIERRRIASPAAAARRRRVAGALTPS
jgi:hypothetical protein